MTFNERVQARWWASIILFIVGFLVAETLVWVMMSFIVFVAIQIAASEQRRLIMVVVQILIGAVYLWSWAVRGIQLVNIDVILRDAGPLERAIIRERIAQELPAMQELPRP
jgi:type VI protein secretion system component VasK